MDVKVAVVGHVEWVDFIRVERLPKPGEILHAEQWWEEPGGGGAVAAAELARLAGKAVFFTALAETELGHRAYDALAAMGLQVHAAFRTQYQRRAITFIDPSGERTIIPMGHRLSPASSDPLPWERLAQMDAVYVSAADAQLVRQLRSAKVVVATSRILPILAESGIVLDALVGSGSDRGEAFDPSSLDPPPRLWVTTTGAVGGIYQEQGCEPRSYAAEPLPGPPADAYGAGDSFAAGLTYGLGRGFSTEQALKLAARCGARAVAGRGAHGRPEPPSGD